MRVLALCLAGWLGSLALAATPVTRDQLAALERAFDNKIRSYSLDDPFDLLGTTRAVYLEGYGVVFTAEVNLVASAVVTPFRPAFSQEEVARLREKKLRRLEDLKRLMLGMMTEIAQRLDSLPAGEQVVVGVSLFRYSWEDSRGLPAQLLMQAPKRVLLSLAGQADPSRLGAGIQIREF